MTKVKSRIAMLAKDVRKLLMKEFPDVKFSVTTENFSGGCSMDVHLMSSREKPMVENAGEWQDGYAQLNQYRLHDDWDENVPVCNGAVLTKFGWETMSRVVELVGYIEGFHYFFDLSIGQSYDKPFVLKE